MASTPARFTRVLRPLALATALGFVLPHGAAAQAVSAADRDALVRLRTDRGGRADDVDALIRVANEAAGKGLPAAALTNKIREGLAKGADPKRIEVVVRQMATHLETADRFLREIDGASAVPGREGREAAVTLLAESLGSGLTPDDVRELRRASQQGGRPGVNGVALASAAKGLAFIREARLPVADGTAVIAEAVRQGFRAQDVVDVGREVKRREADYQTGRESLQSLREAIARGSAPDQLFRRGRPEGAERPGQGRPESPAVERPERPVRPEVPQRPELPNRPERPATGR